MNKIFIVENYNKIQYAKKDAKLAIFIYMYYLLVTYIFGLLVYKCNINGDVVVDIFNNKSLYKEISKLLVGILQIIPIFVILKKSNQPLLSIGISFRNLKIPILLGVIFSIPSILMNIRDFSNIYFSNEYFITPFISLTITSIIEEIVFRGYIQGRLNGIINNSLVRTVIVGILFGITHLPFAILGSDIPLSSFIIPLILSVIKRAGFHVYFAFIYYKSNNLISTIITHTIINFIGIYI